MPRSRLLRASVGAAVLPALGFTLLATPLSYAASPAPEPPVTPGTDGSGAPAHQVDVRRMLGLATDPETVGRAAADPDAPVRTSIPVTPAEAAELDRRTRLSEWSSEAQSDFESGGNFGGSWSEPSTGVLHVAFVGEPSVAAQQRLANKPDGAQLVVERVARSEQALKSLQDRVWQHRPGLRQDGADVVSSYVDVTNNKIVVDVRDADAPRALRALQRALGQDAQGVAVTTRAVSADSGTRDFTTGPAHGGQWMHFTTNAGCTIGFANAQSNSVSTDYYVVTAGHCAAGGTGAFMGRTANTTSLNRVQRTLTTGTGTTTSCDCMIVGPIAGAQRSSDVRVNGNAVFNYTRSGSGADYNVGNSVCLSGAATYEARDAIRCSTIRANDGRRVTNNGTQTINQTVVNGEQAIGGDSGGPWGRNEAWLGVQSGNSGGNSYFGRTNTLSALNVTARY